MQWSANGFHASSTASQDKELISSNTEQMKQQEKDVIGLDKK